jgi:hypothetical protein
LRRGAALRASRRNEGNEGCRFHGDFTNHNGELMGFHGDLMGFNGI